MILMRFLPPGVDDIFTFHGQIAYQAFIQFRIFETCNVVCPMVVLGVFVKNGFLADRTLEIGMVFETIRMILFPFGNDTHPSQVFPTDSANFVRSDS
jgi:hypothetical protein